MRGKAVIGMAGLAAVSMAFVFAGAAWIGAHVEREVDALGEVLAARDDVRVLDFAYHRGLFAGTLRYELDLRPAPEHPLHDLAAAFSADPMFPSVRVSGEARVQHGSFASEDALFVLALTREELALPEALRAHLPEYPGQAPALTITSSLGIDGALRVRTAGVDYRGRFTGAHPDAQGDLVLVDWGGLIELGRTGEALRLDWRIGEITIDVDERDFAAEIRNLALDADTTQHARNLWLGDAGLRAESFRLVADEVRTRVLGLEMRFDTSLDDGMIEQHSSLRIGETMLGDLVLGGGSLELAIRGLEEEAFLSLLSSAERGAFTPQEVADAQNALERLLASGPSMSLDRLSLHLGGTDDVSATLRIYYPPGAPVDLLQPQIMLSHVGASAAVQASTEALMAFARHGVATAAREQGEPLTSDELEVRTQQHYQAMMQAFLFMPFLSVSQQGIRSELEVADGFLRANGQPVMSLHELLELAR